MGCVGQGSAAKGRGCAVTCGGWAEQAPAHATRTHQAFTGLTGCAPARAGSRAATQSHATVSRSVYYVHPRPRAPISSAIGRRCTPRRRASATCPLSARPSGQAGLFSALPPRRALAPAAPTRRTPPPHVLPKAGIHLIRRGLLSLPDRGLRIDRVRGHWHASRLRAHAVPWIASSHVRRRPGGEIGRLGGKSRFGEGSETLLDWAQRPEGTMNTSVLATTRYSVVKASCRPTIQITTRAYFETDRRVYALYLPTKMNLR